MSEFFHMGGHAFYIWLSYAVAVILMVGLLLESMIRLKKNKKMLELLDQDRKSRRAQKGSEA